ncbi:MAG: hypothetical protein N2561_00860 [Bacteroidetes bacterium]|nr:hypothetical protein [Rhodothermia bacterium]MCS7155822.1 hypothetical protein [Bacteroidota bacterium]MCX7906077.1 hypothetical protein [Bacteroidota bacterium]MDW8138205.1 hypothetical protein [Bacteroidota bacterium]MDW8285889.1 hypothetical protein [Bacteroidota bacterium]
MLELPTMPVEVEEIKIEKPIAGPQLGTDSGVIVTRPDVVEAKVYKLRSGFVKHSVYITLGYIEENGRKRPIEIFINSKDLTRAAEYAVLTRLISAIFRKSTDATFILEELKGIYDPNGGYFKNGRYIHSFYAEVAEIIERFFQDIGCMPSGSSQPGSEARVPSQESTELKLCPDCGRRSVKIEAGCLVCIDPDCGYSRCDH